MSKLLNRAVFFIKLIGARITGDRIPLAVVINVTNKCNLRCVYCYGPYYERQEYTRDFTTAELFTLIDDLAKMGAQSITLGGGEPLSREDIGELIDYIKSKGIECGMNSNGMLVAKKIEAVKKLDSICISFDGDKVSHEANRGIGTHQIILDNIKIAKENGLAVHINTVITKNNLESLDYIVEMAKQMGLMAEFTLPFYQVSDNKNQPCLRLMTSDYRETLNKIISYINQGYPVLFSEKAHRYALSWPDYSKYMYLDNKPPFKYIKCNTGRFMCFIDADGHVYPCAQMVGTFQASNFLKVGFRNAWKNLANHNCHACYFVCFNELNYIFNLDMEVIWNTFKKSLKDVFSKK